MEEIWDKTKRILMMSTHFQKRSRQKRYGVALLLVISVFLIKQQFEDFLGDNSVFLLSSFIVAASSWYGGLGPGIFATFLTGFLTYYLFLSTDLAYHSALGDLAVLIIFIVEGLLISVSSEARYEMEKQKDDFISFVSHELKNPLATIKGFSELISGKRTTNLKKIVSYGQQINTQTDKILELINDLLDITKIEIGKFTYTEKAFYIDDLIKEIIEHQEIISPGREIELMGKTNKTIFGDEYRIRQVVVNLVTNAIKYSPDNKKIIITLKKQKDRVVVSIKDFGIGISKDEQLHIFDRYYRTKNVQKKRSEGLGLGLYITSQIINHHHGKIWVESTKGHGSTFSFKLPLRS